MKTSEEMIQTLENELAPLRAQLLSHELYNNIYSIEDIQIFMRNHVFAVWDFMSLLKSLQQKLTCTSVPWVATGNPTTRRFINEIAVAEESDLNECGEPMSHYEMYLDAMKEVGADTSEIEQYVSVVMSKSKYVSPSIVVDASSALTEFVDFTFDVIDSQEAHLVASAFTFGRENLIPDMFTEIVNGLNNNANGEFKKLVYYIERHIEIDGDEHGPMSLAMIEELCGDDVPKWKECIAVSKDALRTRIALWDQINHEILMSRPDTQRAVG